MFLLVGMPESSGGRVRNFPHPASSPWLSTLIFTQGMNNRPIGSRDFKTSHLFDVINQSIKITCNEETDVG
jgi:hypothetical protein